MVKLFEFLGVFAMNTPMIVECESIPIYWQNCDIKPDYANCANTPRKYIDFLDFSNDKNLENYVVEYASIKDGILHVYMQSR